METVDRDGYCFFQRFRPFVALEIIQNNVRLHINTTRGDYKMCMGEMECMVVMSK
jgi:hypothetical protein